jgi:multiple sugar transport system permease protein
VLTAGGPSNSTVTMVITMFREAFSLYDLGSAAAIAMVLLVALVAINALQLALFRDRDTAGRRRFFGRRAAITEEERR